MTRAKQTVGHLAYSVEGLRHRYVPYWDDTNGELVFSDQNSLSGAESREWTRIRGLFTSGDRVAVEKHRKHVTADGDFYALTQRQIGEVYLRVTFEAPGGLPGGAHAVNQLTQVELCRPFLFAAAVLGTVPASSTVTLGGSGSWSNTTDVSAANGVYSTNATAGGTATFVAPLGATRVGVASPIASDGGFASVSIDGDLTLANCCKTAQQYVDEGALASTALTTGGGSVLPTTRLALFYSRARGNDTSTQLREHITLADGLSATSAHTVVLTALALRTPFTGNSANKVYVSGFTYDTPDMTIDTAGAGLYRWKGIHTQSQSATEYAHRVKPTSGGSEVTCGCIHGYETQVTFQPYIDGIPVTLANADRVWGGQACIVKTTTIAPTGWTGNLFNVTTVYTLNAGGPLDIAVDREQLQGGYYAFDYPGMFTVDGWTFTRARRAADPTDVDVVSAADDSRYGPSPSYWSVTWNPSGGELAAVLIPEPVLTVDAFEGPDAGMYIEDTAPSNGSKKNKTYLERVSSGTNTVTGEDLPALAFTAGVHHRSRVQYFYGYVPSVDTLLSVA